MKTIIYSIIFTLSCATAIGQSKNIHVYPISKEIYDDETFYEISISSLSDSVEGISGEVWIKNADFQKDGNKIGTFSIKEEGIISSTIDISISHDSLFNKELYAVVSLEPLNKDYNSVLNELSYKDIILANLENEEITSSLNGFNGAWADKELTEKLIANLHDYGQLISTTEADITINEGNFEGKKMSEMLGTITKAELDMFLTYLNNDWKRFFGQRWNFPKFFAYWMTNVSNKESAQTYKYTENGVGLILTRDLEYSNFPAIKAVNQGYWGKKEKEIIKPGALITRINGISMFNKPLEEVYQKLSGVTNSELTIEVFLDGIFRAYRCPVLQYNNTINTKDLAEIEFTTPAVYEVINGGFWGIIDGEGNYIVEPRLSKLNHILIGIQFSNGLTPFKNLGKWGYMNMLGEIIIEPQFDHKADDFSNGLASILVKDTSGMGEILKGFINTKGEFVSELNINALSSFSYKYKENRCFYCVSDTDIKCGYLDENGNSVIKPIYDFEIMGTWFKNGKAIMSLNKLKGVIDQNGHELLPMKYKRIKRFKNDYFLVTDENGSKMLDENLKHLPQFDKFPLGNVRLILDNNFLIYVDKQPILVDSNAEVYSEFESNYDQIKESGDYNLIAVMKKENNISKWSFSYTDGDVAIEGPFEELKSFHSDVCWVKSRGKWGIIDRYGKWLRSPFSEKMPYDFNGELAKIDVGDFMNPMYFYVNKKGHIVYDPREKFKY